MKKILAILTAAIFFITFVQPGMAFAAETGDTSAISGLEDMSAMTDEEAAAYVDELIAAIQVQEATAETNAQCALAKAAWDALTDEQKELV